MRVGSDTRSHQAQVERAGAVNMGHMQTGGFAAGRRRETRQMDLMPLAGGVPPGVFGTGGGDTSCAILLVVDAIGSGAHRLGGSGLLGHA